MSTILVVDDEIGIRELLSEILSDEGHAVVTAENAAAARALRQSEIPDLVLLDIWMPDTDGVTLLKEWAAGGQLTMPVIMMSGHATIDTAVEATRFGALDFLEKPIALARLLAAVRSGLERGESRPAMMATAAAPAPTGCGRSQQRRGPPVPAERCARSRRRRRRHRRQTPARWRWTSRCAKRATSSSASTSSTTWRASRSR
jgi:DNA-binding NtrC family response regulator